MKRIADHVRLSATDAANHVACRHLTTLDLAVAQVSAIQKRLPDARVGRGDRFQGPQAPVVIDSVASSLPLLYSLNRLNVATSHAKCAAVLVASPASCTVTTSTVGTRRVRPRMMS